MSILRLTSFCSTGLLVCLTMACDEPQPKGEGVVGVATVPDASVHNRAVMPDPKQADRASAPASRPTPGKSDGDEAAVAGSAAAGSATAPANKTIEIGEPQKAPAGLPKTPYDLPAGTKKVSADTKELAQFEYSKRGQLLADFRGRLRNLKARVDTARDEIKKGSQEAAIDKMVETADTAFEDYEESLDESDHGRLAQAVDQKLEALAQAVRPYESVTGKVDAKP